jgi:hypothetical protein
MAEVGCYQGQLAVSNLQLANCTVEKEAGNEQLANEWKFNKEAEIF